jgi:hypothetical protein
MMKSLTWSVALILALVSALIVPSPARAASLFGADAFEAYDSTGKTLGRMSHWAVPFRTAAGHTVLVKVHTSNLHGTEWDLWFTEPGCSGQPLLAGGVEFSSGRRPASAIVGPRRSVYVATGPYRPATAASLMQSGGVCFDVDDPSRAPRIFAPAARLEIDLADYFTPPFHVRSVPGDPIPTGADAEPLDSNDRLVVIDSTGKKVTSAATDAVVTDSGITIPIRQEDAFPYFESNDCSGPMFFLRRLPSLIPQTDVSGPRRSVYRATGFERRTMYSTGSPESCWIIRYRTGPQAYTMGHTGDFTPATPVGLDLADYFTPPFTVRAGNGTRPLPKPD